MNDNIKHIPAFVFLPALVLAASGLADDVITYEQFGAKGDGKADDLPAIVAAHKAANAKGTPVRARDGATYYLHADGLTAEIATDTDFGTAKFVIDDRDITNTWAYVFVVEPTRPSYLVTNVTSLARGMTRVGATFPTRVMVKFEDANRRQFRRTGNANMVNDGQPQQEWLIIRPDGTLDPSTEVFQDMATVTRARAYPIDEKPLTVSGGHFTTIANREIAPLWKKWNGYHRGFSITRANVRVKGIVHAVVDEIDGICPYYGFMRFDNTADVTISDCVFQAHRKTSHGTYDISLGNVVNASFYNCRESTCLWEGGTKYWWAFGSNYCRNILFDGCEFGRFDAHCGVHNATILNSRLAVLAITGGGTFRIENSRLEGYPYFFSFRGDYGSTWNGDIIVRDCTFRPPKGSGGHFSVCQNDGSHDYGYPCHMGRTITVDGLKVENGAPGKSDAAFTWFCTYVDERDPKAPYPYHLPEKVTIRNASCSNGLPPRRCNKPKFFEGLEIDGL